MGPLIVSSLDPVGGEVVDSSERWRVVVVRSAFTHKVKPSGSIAIGIAIAIAIESRPGA